MHSEEVDGAKPTPESRLFHSLLQRRFAWTWYAYLAIGNEEFLEALGRTPEEAAERLRVELRGIHAILEEDEDRDLPTFLAERASRYVEGGLVVFHALDELTAWGGWLAFSQLAVREAFRRWRAVFPTPVIGDDLVASDAERRAALDEIDERCGGAYTAEPRGGAR